MVLNRDCAASIGNAAHSRVLWMHLQMRFTFRAAQAFHIDEGRIQEIAGRRRDHCQRIALRQFGVAGGGFIGRDIGWQRIEPVSQHAGAIELAFPGRCGEIAVSKRRVGNGQLAPTFALQRFPVEVNGTRVSAVEGLGSNLIIGFIESAVEVVLLEYS